MNNNYIESLEAELAHAKRAAEPVIVEEVERTKDKVVYQNLTTGAVRVDLLGDVPPPPVDEDRPRYETVIPSPWTELPREVGKVVSEDEVSRTAKLKSGALRTDLR